MTDTVDSVVLDTETTGWSPKKGDRVIEVAAARYDSVTGELTDKFHEYVNPGVPIEAQATKIHGITNEKLADKPPFAKIADRLANFVRGASVIIHNAPFDVGFLNFEFENANKEVFESLPSQVICSRRMARFVLPPHQSAKLDALCELFGIDLSVREFHGALIDVSLLAQVYLKLVPLAARREEALNSLLPFPRGVELPMDKDALGQAHAAIEQLVRRLEAEQKRIDAVITPLLGGVNYEHRDFTAVFRRSTSVNWKKVSKEHLQKINLSKYKKEFDPKLSLKATTSVASLQPRQNEALEVLLPFPQGSTLREDKDALGRGHTVIGQLINQLKAEQGRIREVIKPMLGGVNYQHPDFTAVFSPNTRTDWDEVVKDYLQGVDLSQYKKTSKPELEIKAA